MDPFKINFVEDFLQDYLKNQDIVNSGFWLDKNMPYLDRFNSLDADYTNPFY